MRDSDRLASHGRWIVVANNMTARVPFAALSLTEVEPYRPLIADHELAQALTVRDALALARETEVQRRAPLRKVAVFSDPVFTRLDKRVIRPAPQRKSEREEPLFVPILRLASSEREGREIAAALGADRVLAYSGFKATREEALKDSLLEVDTLHFATHAVASDAWPNGSGLLLTGTTPDGLPVNGYLSTLDLLSRRARTDSRGAWRLRHGARRVHGDGECRGLGASLSRRWRAPRGRDALGGQRSCDRYAHA